MLRFFRINDPYRLIFIFLILVLIRIGQSFFIEGVFVLDLKWLLLGEWLGKGFHMYRETYDYTGPVAAMIYKYVDLLFGRNPFAHHALSTIVIIIQASLFNRILLKNKAYDENSYLPAFLYTILLVSIPDFMALSPQLMSATFILMGLSNVLRRIDNQVTDELFLNSGIFVGVASMIYLPASIFFFVFLFSLILFSSAITRRLLLYLFGFMLIIGLCMVYFYWRGDLSYFVNAYFVQGLLMDADQLLSPIGIIKLSAAFIVIFFLALFRTISRARLTNFQQRVQQVMWLMFLGGIVCFLLSNKKTILDIVFCVPLIAYFLTHYFILLRNRIFRFIMPGLIIFGSLGFNLFSYSQLTDEVRVNELSSRSSRVLVLGENPSYYVSREAGSPCFSLPICENAFDGLAYYQSSANIYKWITRVDPVLIIDELSVVPALFERFPLLARKYRKNLDGHYIRISN